MPDRPGRPGGSKGGDKQAPTTFFLGRYRVVEEIGIGGMATVHLARMDGPGGFQKWVAIKRIHPNLVEDDQFVDMFLDEARIAAGINHANVAQVFDLGKDEGTYWIAMEYLHGEPLREIMRRCEERNHLMSVDVAARLCADAAEGLHAAHELRGKNGQLLGLVHRDVTPHNLFVTYEGYTKVVDFGIAKVADRLSETRAGTLKGKLAYMSPEQVRGQDDVDRTTDVFALGVVLWELTTGHRLFRMDTDLDTLEKVQACVVPPPSTIVQGYPIELESVVMKALAKKKPERYQTARELSRALQLYLQRRAVLIGPEEVSVFIRELFSDRIQAREAHLAWAADVTSTINIDQLNAMKAARGSNKGTAASGSEAPTDSLGAPDLGRPSVPGPPTVSRRGGPPPPAAGAPAPSSGRAANGAVRPAQPTPQPPPTVPGSSAAKAGLATTSLVDDDEDIPTTVATREHVKDLLAPGPMGLPPPPPAAGRAPARTEQSPDRLQSIRETNMGLGAGHTIAIPPSQAPQFPPTFGAPPPSQRTPGPPTVAFPGGMQPMMPPGGMGQQVPSPPTSQPGYFTPGPFAPVNQHAQQNPLAASPGPFGHASAPNLGHQLPVGATTTGNTGNAAIAARAQLKPSQIETNISIQRPDPAAMWLAQQAAAARTTRDKNTAVLLAVAVLTAICVLALGALVYFQSRRPAAPAPAGSSGLDVASETTSVRA